MKTGRTTKPAPLKKLLPLVLLLALFLQTGGAAFAQAAGSPGLGAVQTARLAALDPAALADFGWSVDVDGSLAVIGARGAYSDNGVNSGAAYVYRKGSYGWLLEAKLTPKDSEAGDTFGVSVSVSGDTVAVGATGKNFADERDTGAVYVFRPVETDWEQIAKIVPEDAKKDDAFGTSLALDGKTLVVGADSHDFGQIPDVGAVYVFINSGGEWHQQEKLLPPVPAPFKLFGSAVDIDNGTAVVGAVESNPVDESGEGRAYVYRRSSQSWALTAELEAEDGREGDFFGNSVAISGSRIVVGAPFSDPVTEFGRVSSAGSAFVFTNRNGVWTREGQLYANDARSLDQLGYSVAIEGSRIVLGAPRKEAWGYSRAGVAYLFEGKNRVWTQVSRILPQEVASEGLFSRSVAFSGGTVLVGANGRSVSSLPRAGETFIYTLGTVLLPETGYTVASFLRQKSRINPLKPLQAAGDMTLEIPKLKVSETIVGVPRDGNGWDTDWLMKNIGYLEGSAFPTWQGNTALAGHVNLPDETAGPFARLKELVYNDRIVIHAWGLQYTYAVQEIIYTTPDDLDVLRHEDKDWITLITCELYDPASDSFLSRLVVRAVLVEVK